MTTIILGCVAVVMNFLKIRQSFMGATQPSISLGYYGWTLAAWWLRDSAFPLIVFVFLRQREVVNLWSGPASTGFEVIPLARRADEALPVRGFGD